MRQTIESYQHDGTSVTVVFDTGGPVGSDHLVIVDGTDYLVNRWFYFEEFDKRYVKNFAAKVIDDPEYRSASLERTADWAQIADIYEEASRRISDVYTDAGLMGYTAGDDAAKRRYHEATTAMEDLCREVFEEIRNRIRNDRSLEDLDRFIEQRVTAAEDSAGALTE
jgi:hypothetical protein